VNSKKRRSTITRESKRRRSCGPKRGEGAARERRSHNNGRDEDDKAAIRQPTCSLDPRSPESYSRENCFRGRIGACRVLCSRRRELLPSSGEYGLLRGGGLASLGDPRRVKARRFVPLLAAAKRLAGFKQTTTQRSN